MQRVLNAKYGPDLTISSAAEWPFSTFAVGTCWDNSPRLNSKIRATIPTNSASHDDSAVRLCFPDCHEIRFGP
eukprot:9056301-Prorocentrum_lima.AAC.1